MSYQWKNASVNETLLYQCVSLLLGYDKRLIEFVFDAERPKLRKRAGILRDDSIFFNETEQLLIRAALDFWSGSGQLALWEMLETWDSTIWTRFGIAIEEYRRLELEETRRERSSPC
jgi:hypothetical protein